MTPPDPLLAAALEQRLAVLAPVAARLRLAVVHPPIAPHDWHGPASRSFADLEERLRASLRLADDSASAAMHAARLARWQVTGG